jgi:YHS domain-containing protein
MVHLIIQETSREDFSHNSSQLHSVNNTFSGGRQEMRRIGLLGSIIAILILGFAFAVFAQQTTAVDPVCGMTVSTSQALNARLGNQTYYFCSDHCLDLFAANPHQYIELGAADVADPPKAEVSGASDHSQGTQVMPAGCGGCPAAASCLGQAKTDPTCGANCGKTRITEVNNFHNILHPIHLAGQRGEIQTVRSTAKDMVAMCLALKNCTLPDDINVKQYHKAQKALQKSLERLVKSCNKTSDDRVLTDLNTVHERYVELQSLVQQGVQ